jgi:hypothetical protein
LRLCLQWTVEAVTGWLGLEMVEKSHGPIAFDNSENRESGRLNVKISKRSPLTGFLPLNL